MYAIDAQVFTTEADSSGIEWKGSRQVPTFYLNPNTQGILTAHGAMVIARDVIDPMHNLSATIYALELETGDEARGTFSPKILATTLTSGLCKGCGITIGRQRHKLGCKKL